MHLISSHMTPLPHWVSIQGLRSEVVNWLKCTFKDTHSKLSKQWTVTYIVSLKVNFKRICSYRWINRSLYPIGGCLFCSGFRLWWSRSLAADLIVPRTCLITFAAWITCEWVISSLIHKSIAGLTLWGTSPMLQQADVTLLMVLQ